MYSSYLQIPIVHALKKTRQSLQGGVIPLIKWFCQPMKTSSIQHLQIKVIGAINQLNQLGGTTLWIHRIFQLAQILVDMLYHLPSCTTGDQPLLATIGHHQPLSTTIGHYRPLSTTIDHYYPLLITILAIFSWPPEVLAITITIFTTTHHILCLNH